MTPYITVLRKNQMSFLDSPRGLCGRAHHRVGLAHRSLAPPPPSFISAYKPLPRTSRRASPRHHDTPARTSQRHPLLSSFYKPLSRHKEVNTHFASSAQRNPKVYIGTNGFQDRRAGSAGRYHGEGGSMPQHSATLATT